MARFYGPVGYVFTTDVGNSVYKETVTERNYYGDIQRNYKRNENSGYLNDNIVLSNTISIVADPYARENYAYIKYVKLNGATWLVTSVDVEYPRLILSVGGLYNEPSRTTV